MELDLPSTIVGAVVAVAATFGLGWVWYHFVPTPQERAERRKAKWEAKAAKRIGVKW